MNKTTNYHLNQWAKLDRVLMGLALEGHPCVTQESGAKMIEITEGGMNVYYSLKNGVYAYLNVNNFEYLYVALK